MKNELSPLHLDVNSLDEVKTLLECEILTGQDIEDDLLESIINLD